MSKASDFVKKGKLTLQSSTLKSINDLLAVLNSEILYPINKDGSINEARLLAVVKSRGEAYNTAVFLSDKIELDRSRDTNLKNKFMNALKTTFNEMDEILKRDIRSTEEISISDDENENDETIFSNDLSDDYIALLSKTKKEAYLLNVQILDRIAQLDNPEELNKQKLENIKGSSIAELYADE